MGVLSSIPPPNPWGFYVSGEGRHIGDIIHLAKLQKKSKHSHKSGSFLLLYLVASCTSGGSQVPPGHKNKLVASEGCPQLQWAFWNADRKAALVYKRSSAKLEGSSLLWSLQELPNWLACLQVSLTLPRLHSTESPFWNAQHFSSCIISCWWQQGRRPGIMTLLK